MKRFAIYWAVLTLLSAFSLTLSAQGAEQVGKNEIAISDAWVSREGRTLIIDYDINMGGSIISCDVALMMSVDGGHTFSPVAVTEKVKGDVGRITTSGQKQITYDIDSIKESLAGKKLAFKVQVKNKKKVQDDKGRVFIMGTGSTLKMFGLKAGYVKKFGGYVSYKDSFTNYWNTGGFNMLSNFSVTGGVVMRVNSWLYPYIGAGGGQLFLDDPYLRDYIDKYGVFPVDYRFDKELTLVPIEIGSIFRIGQFMLSAAVEPVIVLNKGVLCTFGFGVGFCF
ncbi:MAG: hypothetical protein IJ450_00215 [Bacteroidales bacterium]|nr:hypothetical protein [Bacteroidales bacterium]